MSISFVINIFVYSCGFDDTHQLVLRDYIFSRNYKIYLMARFTISPMFLFLLNSLSEINFKDRQDKLKKKIKCENTCNITFIAHYLPKAEILQRIIRKYWHLIKNYSTVGIYLICQLVSFLIYLSILVV
jgi:hypothetical protein